MAILQGIPFVGKRKKKMFAVAPQNRSKTAVSFAGGKRVKTLV